MTPIPPLPATAFTLIGEIPVEIVEDLRDENGKEAFGFYHFDRRLIQIRAGLEPRLMWMTFYHELVHALLGDVGVELPKQMEERVCDALGLSLAAMFLADRN